VTAPPAPSADVLREPRAEARLRHQKLAEAPDLSPRATSDLKRVATPARGYGAAARRTAPAWLCQI